MPQLSSPTDNSHSAPASQQSFLLAMRDILDEQLETADGRHIGRVADAVIECGDGLPYPILTYLITGPQALAGRVWEPLRPVVRRLLRDRFEHWLPLGDVTNFGPTVRLRGVAQDYALGQADRWLARRILRWLPGSGYHALAQAQNDPHQGQRAKLRDSRPVARIMRDIDTASSRAGTGSPSCFYMEDLIGSSILSADGRHIGKVIDVRLRSVEQPSIESLVYGATGWLYRLNVLRPLATFTGGELNLSLIPWEQVATFRRNRVVVSREANTAPH